MDFGHMLAKLPSLARLGAVVCALVIAVLSLMPGSDLPAANLNDKLNHFIAYGALTAFGVIGRWPVGRVVLVIMIYGLVLEGLQGIMPFGRSASVLDALANAGGVVIGTALGLAVRALLGRLTQP